jgi:hypothetical protein
MREQAKPAWAGVATMVAFFACAYTFYSNTLCVLYGSYDTGWIIRTGQYILQSGFPSETLFSWAVQPQAYVAYQWLFAIFNAVLFEIGSLWLVGFVACIAASILILFALPQVWIRKGIPAAIPLAVLAVVQTPHWFNARPQICSYFFLLATICILEKNRSTGSKFIFLLPLLMVLWINTHAFWSIGLLAVVVYLIAHIVREKKIPPALAVTTALCIAAIGLNPYGLQLPAYLATFANGSQYSKIYELHSWITSPHYWWTLFYVPFAAWLLHRYRKSVPAEGIILCAIACVAALCMRRFEPVFVIMSWPSVGTALAQIDWAKKFGEVKRPVLRTLATACVALVVPVFAWYAHFPTLPSAWMVYTEDTYPLLKIVQENTKADERLFHTPVIGSWLLAMNGQKPVFVDSRFDAYPKQFLEMVDRYLEASPATLQFLDQNGFNHIVIRDDMPLALMLMSSPNWTIALDDGMVSWWTRTTNQPQISVETLPPHIAKATLELQQLRQQHLQRALAGSNARPQ